MIVQKNSVVDLHFTIKDKSGALLDATEPDEPVSCPLGSGYLLAGIEEALQGNHIGDEITLQLPPDRAFGLVNPSLKRVVSIDELNEEEGSLEVGDSIVLHDAGVITWTVYKMEHDQVYIDGNHPFAGKTVNIWFKIAGIKDSLPTTRVNEQVSAAGGTCSGPGCCC